MEKICVEGASRLCVSAMASNERLGSRQARGHSAVISARSQAAVAGYLAAHGVKSVRELVYYVEQKCLAAHAEAEKQENEKLCARTYEALHAIKAVRDIIDLDPDSLCDVEK